MSNKQAFTLVELAIVLVIVGLIIGGIMVGLDMVKSAETRAQVRQIEGYVAAAQTFREKYNCIPGDCVKATQFGLGNNGDGNGQLLPGNFNFATQWAGWTSESVSFWYHLAQAGLTDFPGLISIPPSAPYTQAQIVQTQPAAKVGNNVYILATQFTDFNMGSGVLDSRYVRGGNGFFLTGLGTIGSQATFPPGLTPFQAYALDTKVDDGQPFGGKIVQGKTNFASPSACSPISGSSSCSYSYTACSTGYAYSFSSNNPECNLAFLNRF